MAGELPPGEYGSAFTGEFTVSEYKAGDSDRDGLLKSDCVANPPALGGLDPELRGPAPERFGANVLPWPLSSTCATVGRCVELDSDSSFDLFPSAIFQLSKLYGGMSWFQFSTHLNVLVHILP